MAGAAQKQIRYYCQNDPELRQLISLLTTIPGIDVIVATHLVARLGDPALITNVRQIAGFLGLRRRLIEFTPPGQLLCECQA